MEIGKREALRLEMLLAMRDCARGSPQMLKLEVDLERKYTRQAAKKQIENLEKEGYIQGYIPITDLKLFGNPYLVTIVFDKESYKDIQSYIEDIEQYLEKGGEFALIATYCIEDESNLQFHCIIITNQLGNFTLDLVRQISLDKKIVSSIPLIQVKGIPNYSRHSIKIQEGNK